MSRLRYRVFFLAMFIIYAIACYDIYCTIRTGEYIVPLEKNPIAKKIILAFGPAFFVAIKGFVTIVAIQTASTVYLSRRLAHKYRLIIEGLIFIWFVEQIVTLCFLLS